MDDKNESTGNPKLVSALEKIMERAKNGDLTAIAIALEYRSGGVATFSYCASGDVYRLVGAVEHAKKQILDAAAMGAQDEVVH